MHMFQHQHIAEKPQSGIASYFLNRVNDELPKEIIGQYR
jgi:hypothetical protein